MEARSRQGVGGPKTPEGRARASMNAVKHGLTAQSPVALSHESEAAWQEHLAGILLSLAPVGRLEQVLAEKIALTLWRQTRVNAYETLRTNLRLENAATDVENNLWSSATEEDAQIRLRYAYVDRLLLPDEELRRVQRYEAHLGRELSRLFKHFQYLQSLRRRPPQDDSLSDSVPVPSASHPSSEPSPSTSPSAANTSTPPQARAEDPANVIEPAALMPGRAPDDILKCETNSRPAPLLQAESPGSPVRPLASLPPSSRT